jgi:hypothetical protein
MRAQIHWTAKPIEGLHSLSAQLVSPIAFQLGSIDIPDGFPARENDHTSWNKIKPRSSQPYRLQRETLTQLL